MDLSIELTDWDDLQVEFDYEDFTIAPANDGYRNEYGQVTLLAGMNSS